MTHRFKPGTEWAFKNGTTAFVIDDTNPNFVWYVVDNDWSKPSSLSVKNFGEWVSHEIKKMTSDELEAYTAKVIKQTRLACASMCRARESSLLDGRMIAAANEASKCALAIETHPAFIHHYRKFENEQTD